MRLKGHPHVSIICQVFCPDVVAVGSKCISRLSDRVKINVGIQPESGQDLGTYTNVLIGSKGLYTRPYQRPKF